MGVISSDDPMVSTPEDLTDVLIYRSELFEFNRADSREFPDDPQLMRIRYNRGWATWKDIREIFGYVERLVENVGLEDRLEEIPAWIGSQPLLRRARACARKLQDSISDIEEIEIGGVVPAFESKEYRLYLDARAEFERHCAELDALLLKVSSNMVVVLGMLPRNDDDDDRIEEFRLQEHQKVRDMLRDGRARARRQKDKLREDWLNV